MVAVIIFILQTPPSKNTDTMKQRVLKLDPFGSLVFLPAIVCLLLALQWGGATYAWTNARIIVLFILAGILLIIFVIIQFKSGDNATVPIRVINQRSIMAGAYFSIFGPGSMMVTIYFLPIYFQAIKGVSAVHSGINTLPLVLALVVAAVLGGIITNRTGYYTGQLWACTIIMSVAAGLITTLKVDTPSKTWIGYEILYGFGLGLGMQQSGMAAQTCLERKDVMTGVSLMFFMQGLGGAIMVTVGQTVFTHSLITNLGKVANLDTAQIVNSGATDLKSLVPPAMLHNVLVEYNAALSNVFKVGLACACATVIGSLAMQWKSVKGLKQGGQAGEAEREKEREQAKDQGQVTGTKSVDGTDVDTPEVSPSKEH